MDQILQNEYATVAIDKESRLVEVKWLQHCENSTFREILTKVLHQANADAVIRWLCDMRELKYVLVADQNWLVKELLPSLNPSLSHRFSYVVSRTNLELMSSLQIQDMVREDPRLSDRFELEVFLNKEEATDWLS